MNKLMCSNSQSFQLGIYIHIPFCSQKCFYCDFNSGPIHQATRKTYLRSLNQEITLSPWKNATVKTLFLGGGTPSELTSFELENLISTLKKNFVFSDTIEQTIECNPESLDLELATSLYSTGFNRISLGIQSFYNHHLQNLGRIHNVDQIKKAYELIRKVGFTNINFDLLFGLPNQSLEEWKTDLHKAIELSPEHLSLYNLTIEPGTNFGLQQTQKILKKIDEDLVADMYEMAMDTTADANYEQYETSHYCQPNRECAHNMIYWQNKPYLGFGVSATSLINGIRSTNTENLDEYTRTIDQGQPKQAISEKLEGIAALKEEIMLRLHTREGISLKTLSRRYQCDVTALFSESLNILSRQQLIIKQKDKVRLTRKGKLFADQVCLQFL
jgi:oxygen-independent coproporphyrinogen-3 oxidase